MKHVSPESNKDGHILAQAEHCVFIKSGLLRNPEKLSTFLDPLQSVFLPPQGQNGSKITLWTPCRHSSNPVIARSSRAGGAFLFMESPESNEKIIRLLLPRLERISVDSYWAHRASGVRGALVKILDRIETGEEIDPAFLKSNILMAFEILKQAAEEYL